MASGLTRSTARSEGLECEGSWLEDTVGLRPLGKCAYVPQPAFGMVEVRGWGGGRGGRAGRACAARVRLRRARSAGARRRGPRPTHPLARPPSRPQVDWKARRVALSIRDAASGDIAVGKDGGRQEVAFSLDTCLPIE
jgi:hypothetical protein